MEIAIESEIIDNFKRSGEIDIGCLVDHFQNSGERLAVRIIPKGGPNGADVFRFTVDNSNLLENLISVPGGSNGVFTAILIRNGQGSVAIVERGGKLRWLKFE
jgi:hypothetical protein